MYLRSPAPYYFGYGDLLDPGRWSKVCSDSVHDPRSLIPIAPAALPDAELVFDYDCPLWQGGVLNLRLRPRCFATGFLFSVHDRGWNLLDGLMKAPMIYLRHPRKVVLGNGTSVLADTYEIPIPKNGPFVSPSRQYLHHCLKGRRSLGVETQSIEAAAFGWLSVA